LQVHSRERHDREALLPHLSTHLCQGLRLLEGLSANEGDSLEALDTADTCYQLINVDEFPAVARPRVRDGTPRTANRAALDPDAGSDSRAFCGCPGQEAMQAKLSPHDLSSLAAIGPSRLACRLYSDFLRLITEILGGEV